PGWPEADRLWRPARQGRPQGHREVGSRHAAEEPSGSSDDQQAQGLLRTGSSARRPEAPAVRDHADLPVSEKSRFTVAETTTEDVEYTTNAEGVAYTSE